MNRTEDKVGLNKWGNPSKTGRDWNEKAGRLADLTPEERKAVSSAGGKKKAENGKKRKEIEALLQDKEALLDASIATVMEDNPGIVDKVMETIFQQAADGDTKAQSLVLQYTGLSAAKRTEVKIKEDKLTEAEAMKILMGKMHS